MFARLSVYFSRRARTGGGSTDDRGLRDWEALCLWGTLEGKWRSAMLIRARLRLRVPAYWLVIGTTRGDATAQLDMVRNTSAGGCEVKLGEYRVKSADPATSLQAGNRRERSAGPLHRARARLHAGLVFRAEHAWA